MTQFFTIRFKYLILTSLIFLICFTEIKVLAQENFADKCIGKWEGTMYIYAKGKIRDSVQVQLIVEKTNIPNTWTWRTNYFSTNNSMQKDYKLILKDSTTQTYVTDEGNGIELMDYQFNNKLYSIFETHNVMLTSSYELLGNHLIFEVTSGKKIEGHKELTNYSVINLQRVVFKKVQ